MNYLNLLQQFFTEHWALLCYIGVAGITALHPPGTPDGGFYGWFYRFAVGLLPIAKHELPAKVPDAVAK
jgi:hypothetical protein